MNHTGWGPPSITTDAANTDIEVVMLRSELDRLFARLAEAERLLALADDLAQAADALLDIVTVAATPDPHLGRVATRIVRLHETWKRWNAAKFGGNP